MRNHDLLTGVFIFALIGALVQTGCKPQSLEPTITRSNDVLQSTSSTSNLAEYQTQMDPTCFTPPHDSAYFFKLIRSAPVQTYLYDISTDEADNVSLQPSGDYIWQESIPFHQGSIDIKASIQCPEMTYHPVYLIRDHDFTQSDFDRVATVLFPNALGILGQDPSRLEVEAELSICRLGQISAIDPTTHQTIYQPYHGQEQDIAQLQELLNSMPADSLTPLVSHDFSAPGSFKILTSNQSILYLEIRSNQITATKDRACRILPQTDIRQDSDFSGLYRSLLKNLPPTPTRSIDQCVHALITALCPNGLIHVSVERALSVHSETNIVYSIGYFYTFARSLGEDTLPPLYALKTGTRLFHDPIHNNPVPTCSYETITIFADDTGPRYIVWNNAFDPIRIANSNVSLLPFADIQRAIRSAAVSLASRSTLELSGKNIEIQQLTLTNTIQQNPENSSYAFIAPAWIVSAEARSDAPQQSFAFAFAISAIDGRFVPLVP